jgi:acyl carrier protein
MTPAEIQSVLLDELGRVAPEVDLARLDPDANVREALDIDSFDALRIIIAISERLGVEIPESEYGELTTVSRMVRYLGTLVS